MINYVGLGPTHPMHGELGKWRASSLHPIAPLADSVRSASSKRLTLRNVMNDYRGSQLQSLGTLCHHASPYNVFEPLRHVVHFPCWDMTNWARTMDHEEYQKYQNTFFHSDVPRGVVKARQYGDSYLVLKDVRLRCSMCSTDSGGAHANLIDATADNFPSDSRILASSTVVLGKICLRMSEWAFANNCKLYSLCIALYCIWICAGLTSGMQRKRLGVLDKYAHVFFGRVRNNLYIACSFGRQPIEEGGVPHSDLDTVFKCWKCKRVLKTSWSAKTSARFLHDMSKCISNEVVRH